MHYHRLDCNPFCVVTQNSAVRTWKPMRDFSKYAMQCASLMHPPSADWDPLRSHAMRL